MTQDYTLYGMQASLYTGKVRAYMRRNRIPVTERGAGHPEFTATIYPKTGRFIMPVIVTPDGEVVQDGTDILDHFDRQDMGTEPLYPNDPVLKAVSLLFELYGNEGLLRPAMHYRWNFDAENLAFLKASFADVLPAGLDPAAQSDMFDHASGRMRKAAKAFGVNPDTYADIEAAYADFLARLNAHLATSYYLLGDRPTIGDYGLFNPLYAHLARDPKPAHLMKTTAPYVWNWVERMNAPEQRDEHTIKNPPTSLFAANALPDTLTSLMSYVAEEYLAEVTAHVDFANQWLADKPAHIEMSKSPQGRSIGFAEFDWRGQRISSVVMLYRFYLLQRLQDHVAASPDAANDAITDLFTSVGLGALLDIRTDRRVAREDYNEVWV